MIQYAWSLAGAPLAGVDVRFEISNPGLLFFDKAGFSAPDESKPNAFRGSVRTGADGIASFECSAARESDGFVGIRVVSAFPPGLGGKTIPEDVVQNIKVDGR